MLFYEPLFLFLFAPAVYGLYLLIGGNRGARLGVLLAASLLFYAWSEPLFVFVVLGSAFADVFIARRIDALAPDDKARKLWLALGVAANLGLLVYFKYAGFLVANLDVVLRALTMPGLAFPAIALPIGVSFIVFEKITYLVDVHRGVTKPAQSLSLYAFYVFFFPKLLAGPIVKYHDIAEQLARFRHATSEDFVGGLLALHARRRQEAADRRHARRRRRSRLLARRRASRLSPTHGRACCSSPSRSISISPAIPTWRSASRACSAFGCRRISTCPMWRRASPNSGAAGTCR